jgi:hypothetical protein
MVLMPMTAQMTDDSDGVSSRCEVCGRFKEAYQLFDPDGDDPEPPQYEIVCPREWAHGPAEDQ